MTGADGTDVAGGVPRLRRGDRAGGAHPHRSSSGSVDTLRGSTGQGGPDDIRASGKKVVPVCSYVEAYVGRHPEYADMAVPVPR